MHKRLENNVEDGMIDKIIPVTSGGVSWTLKMLHTASCIVGPLRKNKCRTNGNSAENWEE
jgi:hypothetical protein